MTNDLKRELKQALLDLDSLQVAVSDEADELENRCKADTEEYQLLTGLEDSINDWKAELQEAFKVIFGDNK